MYIIYICVLCFCVFILSYIILAQMDWVGLTSRFFHGDPWLPPEGSQKLPLLRRKGSWELKKADETQTCIFL